MEDSRPGGYTDDGVYIPRSPVVLAFSFEGIVNDGAPECGLNTFNAYRNLSDGYDVFGRTVEPEEFGEIRYGEWMTAFLRMRPAVNKAWQYFIVVDILRDNPAEMQRIIEDQWDIDAFRKLQADYDRRCGEISQSRLEELDGAFYAERTRMSTVPKGEVVPHDMGRYMSWASIQGPFRESQAELKKLRRTMVIHDMNGEEPKIVAGFVPSFATSKDETSTKLLCKTYVEQGLLEPDDYDDTGVVHCTIPDKRIYGKEREVPQGVKDLLREYYASVYEKRGRFPDSRDKLVQLVMIAQEHGLPHDRVWRINDRYDRPEQSALWEYGFNRQFLLPGYTFPFEFEEAERDGMVFVKKEMLGSAEFLGKKAKDFGH